MLLELVKHDVVADRRADYTANMLWSLTGAVFSAFGGEFKTKSWGEIIEPATPQTSGEDIRETLMKRWGGGE